MKKVLVLNSSFPALPYYQRFALASAAGFKNVALDAWTDLDFSRVNALRAELGLTIAAISGSQGETLTDPSASAGFLEHLAQSIAVARSFGCGNLVLTYAPDPTGPTDPTDPVGSASGASGRPQSPDTRTFVRTSAATATLMNAAAAAAKAGVTLLLKPASGALPGAAARAAGSAADVVRRLALPALRLYVDLGELRPPIESLARRLQPVRAVAGFVHVAIAGAYSAEAGAEIAAALEGESGYTGLVGFSVAGE